MSKNVNIKTLNVNTSGFFNLWLVFLKPYHKLKESEMKFLSLLLQKRFELFSKINDDNLVDKLLFDKEVKSYIQKEMGYGTAQAVTNLLSDLRKKDIIENNKINRVLIPNLSQDANNFKLIFNFNINEN